jgi:hypothetical protein
MGLGALKHVGDELNIIWDTSLTYNFFNRMRKHKVKCNAIGYCDRYLYVQRIDTNRKEMILQAMVRTLADI